MANSGQKAHMRFVLGRHGDTKFARMSVGDHKILKYYAKKENKTMGQMLHELFLLGLKCKTEYHVARLRRLGIDV